MWMDYSIIHIPENGILMPSEYYRYLLVIKGSGKFMTAGHEFKISHNDFLYIPSQNSGRLKSDTGIPFCFGCIELRDFRSTAKAISILPEKVSEYARKIFYLGLDMQECDLPYYETVKAALHQLMFSSLVAGSITSWTVNPNIFAVIDDINHHFTECDYDVRTAIERTGYTINHFRKIFKKEVGITPSDFVLSRRLDRAEELMIQFRDRIPIKDISLQCGFSDPYYFSRMFKKRRGLSPSDFIDTYPASGKF